MRAIGRWFQPIVLIGFLFPFLLVSCNGQTLVQAEGWRLAFGVSVEIDEELEEELAADAEEPTGAYWVAVALLASVAAFGLSYTTVRSRLVAVFPGLAVLALIAFWVRATADLPSTELFGFSVSQGLGYWLVLVLSALSGAAFLWDDLGRPTSFPVRGSPVDEADSTHCTQCGRPTGQHDKFCASCGTPMRT